MSRPARLDSRTLPPRTSASARTPSHFISYAQPLPRGTSCTSVASIGCRSGGWVAWFIAPARLSRRCAAVPSRQQTIRGRTSASSGSRDAARAECALALLRSGLAAGRRPTWARAGRPARSPPPRGMHDIPLVVDDPSRGEDENERDDVADEVPRERGRGQRGDRDHETDRDPSLVDLVETVEVFLDGFEVRHG